MVYLSGELVVELFQKQAEKHQAELKKKAYMDINAMHRERRDNRNRKKMNGGRS